MGIRKMKTKKKQSYRAEIRVRGKRYSKNFQTEEAATAWINGHQVLKTQHPGSNQHERKLTLGQAFSISYDLSIMKGDDERTTKFYVYMHRQFESILDVNIPDLSVEQLVESFKKIRNEQSGEILSQSYYIGILCRLRDTLVMAGKKGFFMENFEQAEAQIENFIASSGKEPLPTILYTEKDLGLLLQEKRFHHREPYWVLPMIKIFLMTGKRIGEILAITMDSIDLERNRIFISKMISGRQYHDHLKANAPAHYVKMDKELREVVVNLLNINKELGLDSVWLFPAPSERNNEAFPTKQKCPYKGKPIQDSSVRSSIQTRMRRVGLKRAKIHDFRKIYATYRLLQLLKENNPYAREIVQRELNHRSMFTTEKYIRLAEEMMADGTKVNLMTHVLGDKSEVGQNNVQSIEEMLTSVGLISADIDWELLRQLLSTFSKLQKKAA